MSESSKMGLFGSKDDKKESTSDDATKPDSPERYSPYCIDSDSETYNTEALSIMDINDIIGVQTGQAVESTLESEIAALTEIITDSKSETNADMMDEIHEKSSDPNYSEELLSDFTTLSPSENLIPTTSKEVFQERFVMHKSGTGNGDQRTSNKFILENTTSITDETEDRTFEDVIKVKTDVEILDKITNKGPGDVAFGLMEQNNELDGTEAESESEKKVKDETLFSTTRNSHDIIQKDEVLASEEAKLPTATDTTSESEIITDTISKTATDLLDDASKAGKMSSVDEGKEDDKDSSKCENVTMVSVEDVAKNSPNSEEGDDCIKSTKSEIENIVDDPEDEKSTDLLTNVGSTSKSLQLIGEAYISEDSQETDEKDESPVMKVGSVLLAGITEEGTEKENDEQQQKGCSDNVLPFNNELKVNTPVDTTENAVQKRNLDNRNTMSLEDNNIPDKATERQTNLEDNRDNHSQDINADLKINVHSKDDRVIEESESVDPSLRNDEIQDKSNKLIEAKSPLTLSIAPGTSATLETTPIIETLGTKEESSQEIVQLENIPSKSEAPTNEMITVDVVSKVQTGRSLEGEEGTTTDVPRLPDEEVEVSETDVETLNSNPETVSEIDEFSTQNQEASEETEALPSVVSSCSETESNNITGIIPEIQNENRKPVESVESLVASDEQDHVASIESNNVTELVDSQSIEKSISSLQHSVIVGEVSKTESESSMSPVGVDTNLVDEVDQYIGATKSATEVIPTEEQSNEISENVEELLETVKENRDGCIVENRTIEKDTPLIMKITGDEKTKEKDEDISINKMVVSVEKKEEKIKSDELQIDDKSQSSSMRITSPIVEKTVIDSSENRDHLGIEKSKEEIDESEKLGTEFDQLASTSNIDSNVPLENIMEVNKQDTTKLLETSQDVENQSSDIVNANPSSSKILEEDWSAEKDNSTEIETVELSEAKLSEIEIKIEGHIGSQSDSLESEALGRVTKKHIPESMIKTTLEKNSAPVNVKLSSLEIVESDSNKDYINEVETIEKSREFQEVCETERVSSKHRIVSKIVEADEAEVSDTDVCDRIEQLEENESTSDISVNAEKKQMENTSDQMGLEKSENLSEANTEMVCGFKKAVAEISTMKNPLEQDNDSQSTPQHKDVEEELKIEVMQHQSDGSRVAENPKGLDDESESTRNNDKTQCQELSPLNAECSSADVSLYPQSETSSSMIDKKQESSEIQPEEPENETDLQAENDNTLPSILCDVLIKNVSETVNKTLPDSQVEEDLDTQRKLQELQEMESTSSVLSNVSKLLEKEEQFEKEKLPSIKPVDAKNLENVANIHSSEDTLKLEQSLSGENDAEASSGATEINLTDDIVPITLQSDDLTEMDMKIDEDLQCEPIEELEKLAVVADDISIDELANSVLKDTVQPLENIDTLGILPDSHLSISTIIGSDELNGTSITNESSEIDDQPVALLGVVQTCFIEDLDQTQSVSHGADYITDVIMSSTNIDNIELADNIQNIDENVTADEFEDKNQGGAVKTSENSIPRDTVSIDQSITRIGVECELEIGGNLILDKNIELQLPLKLEEETLIESVVLQACDVKIDLPDEVLFDTENAEQSGGLCNVPTDTVDTSQQSSEFSELECAVKFLQESEEQTIDSPLLLSPKITEEIVGDNLDQSKSCLFLSETEVCQDTLEIPVELEEITPDSIAISEAEIISEAAKLENERKLKIAEEIIKTSVSIEKLDEGDKRASENNSEMLKSLLTTPSVPGWQKKSEQNTPSTSEKSVDTQVTKLLENIIRKSEKIPKISILEERLKEPPKIEIPVPEISPKISDTPTTPKTSLLMQRDSRIDTKILYQKMLESPKGSDKVEPKLADTPRKDSDKYDFENVGSPRIILKIAKSAIADCAEPRSPKSPKIRSAANSPNPEDSPGQKLGKIKLKLSKGGHPSIIPNENYDESAQRHTEATVSPSHIGMKIKLSRTGDASIIQPDKYDSIDDMKETKHKFEESSPKRIESPLGVKIKLSKTGDPSIVQQESKESTSKRKDKSDVGQEIPKKTDSPIGMKIKLSKSGDASIIQPEKQEITDDVAYTEVPKRTESPIGMKIKLSKTGDASIILSECSEEFKESPSRSRDKLGTTQDIPKRTDSPLGMKFKLSKSGGASIIQPEKSEGFDDFRDKSEISADVTKRVESPIGMKIKLSKTGDASIIHPEKQETDEHRESIIIKHREKSETQDIQRRTDSPLGMRIKVTKTGEASVVPSEEFRESLMLNTESFEMTREVPKRTESPIGMKIKLSKSGDASIIHPEKQDSFDESKDFGATSKGSLSTPQEGFKSSESSFGMKIKLSKTGDASIIHPEISPECRDSQSKRTEKLHSPGECSKRTDSPLGMKIKLSKTGDASIIEPDKREKTTTKYKEKLTNIPEVSQKRKEMEYPLEMKIKLSKTGHPTIIANEKQESFAEMHSKIQDYCEIGQSTHHKHIESTSPGKDSQLRIFKTGHSTIIQSSRSEVTIEPVQMHQERSENSLDISPKCNKEFIISPIDQKTSKLEAKLSHILPEVTIQPVTSGEQQQVMLDKKSSTISRQQMSVINQEISITHVSSSKPADLSMSGKLKEILRKNATNSPASSDCEIIEHRPELIIVNENSNSSQDIMIIEEVKPPPQEIKVPRKRGRPKRSSLPPGQTLIRPVVSQDPLALDNARQSAAGEHRESDRPKRTCRSQKSYAPPKRGRGRGRGKRKLDRMDCSIGKIPRLEDPLTAIERSTMSLIAPLQLRLLPEATAQTSELYKALKQSPEERKRLISENLTKQGFPDIHKKLRQEPEPGIQTTSSLAPVSTDDHFISKPNVDTSDSKAIMISEMLQRSEPGTAQQATEKLLEVPKPDVQETKNVITDMTTTEHQNWLTPSIKLPETTGKTEPISMVQVMDEETRMSAESNSRSQTPARNISIPAVETVINEESQGSVLSTATTESEKVKVRNRRMEINFDPDEGPFTVDKIAEYEWPLDKKGDTFMIQEQISQYLGVKSFKRKYPDLKRRMVEMEERNFLRENCLVSEAMCDMGLTAICSSEVLDIMCSDFPDQYEEYRKHMREKQAKEHSKKQKELTAAANAERNRIDLAEMAVQSALSWNVNFNRARKESRKYSLDLQSFTIHVPKKQLKVDPERKASNYPVALIPGQYTDYYKEYTPAELRYYPLNTVLYGPMKPNERKFDSQSEGSQSDSDSDSSSDDSSSSSSEGTQDTEESQSTVDEVEMEISSHKEDNKNLKCKMCLKHLNKHGKAEVLIQCGTCNGNVHPSCIDLTLDMVPHIQGYSWQCTDCKTCVQCHNPADEDKMLFCDMCDRGYHIYCVGLRRVPQGRWHCRECAVCASCGLRQPGGANSDRNSVAQWQHEYKKGERNTRVYVSTLCVPCSKLWRKGRYCPHCSRCHSAQRLDLEPNLVHCGACDKYLHLGCVEMRSGTLDRKNYICDWCSTPGQQISRSLLSKNFRT